MLHHNRADLSELRRSAAFSRWPLIAGTIGLLVLVPPISSEGQGHGHVPQFFRFTTRLHSTERVVSIQKLRKGTLLQPFNPAGGGRPLQAIVLCHDIEVRFGEDGLSDPVKIEGFCYAPGRSPAPEHFDWRITHWVDEKVANAEGCGPELGAATRRRQVDLRQPFQGEIIDTCFELLPDCLKRFDAETKRQFDEEFRVLEDHSACSKVIELAAVTLICDRDKAKAVGAIRRHILSPETP